MDRSICWRFRICSSHRMEGRVGRLTETIFCILAQRWSLPIRAQVLRRYNLGSPPAWPRFLMLLRQLVLQSSVSTSEAKYRAIPRLEPFRVSLAELVVPSASHL